MTTTRNRSKNKKMKLYKRIEGGGRLKINEEYLKDRTDYAYAVLFPESVRQSTFGDNSPSPFYLLGTSANADKAGEPNPFITPGPDINKYPVQGFANYYKNYLAGDFTRAAEFENVATNDPTMQGLINFGHQVLNFIGLGKPHPKRKKLKGSGLISNELPRSGDFRTNYDEFKERTEPDKRLGVLKIKQFMAFCDFINEVGKFYRKGLLKFIKDNIDRAYPVGIDIDFNVRTEEGFDMDKIKEQLTNDGLTHTPENIKKQIDHLNGPGILWKQYFVKDIDNRKATSYYGDVAPPAPDATETQQANYKKVIRAVNNALYNSVRSQVTDNPENPSLIIPSPFWFGGDLVKVSGDIDVRTTVPQSLYTELLALQHTYESEIFNAKAPSFIPYLQNNLKELYDNYNAESKYISSITQAVAGSPVDSYENEEKLKAEYQRQLAADEILRLQEKQYDSVDIKNTNARSQVENGIRWVLLKVKDFKDEGGKTAFQNWLRAFIQSEEYALFIKSQNMDLVNANDAADKDYEKKVNPTLDVKALAATKTFYNAEVFEEEDVDSLNTDLIKKLRDQEAEFNKTLSELNAPFVKAQEEQKAKNDASLEALRKKVDAVSADMFKKLDEGMAKNKQNRIDRTKQKTERELLENTMEEEDSALASLKNYRNCSGAPPPQLPPERIYQDVNLQDAIKKASNELAGGRKKNNSIAYQIYMLNKRYVDSNGFESPMIRTNSARKKGGAVNTQTTTVDPSLNIQGATTDYNDLTAEEKVIADMNMAQDILGTAQMVVGFIPIVGDFLDAAITVTNMILSEETAKKERELEEKRKENERLLESWYAWKDNMQSQTIQTLSTQEDPKIYEKMKKTAMDSFRTIDPRDPPTSREVKAYGRLLDDERDAVIASRKAITDQYAMNAEDITGVIADTLEAQDEASSDLIDEGFNARKKVIDEFTTKLKNYVKDFMTEQGELDKQDAVLQKQADAVADIVDKKQDELDDEAEDIAQLKGYSACKSNVKSQEQMKEDALNELKEQEKKREEDVAQGKVSMEGLGKRYKKNSIANQVYMLNARYINSF